MALAVEEGMIRNIAAANRVTSDGIGAYFDVELGDCQAVGQIIDQVYKRIAYESIIGTAQTAIAAMTNHESAPGLRPCTCQLARVARQTSSTGGLVSENTTYLIYTPPPSPKKNGHSWNRPTTH